MPAVVVAVINLPKRQATCPSLPVVPPKPANSSVRSESLLYSHSGISGLIGKVVTVPPPINTLGESSQLVLSPTRKAGWPLMLTLSAPCAICMLGLSLRQATWLLVASVAGLPLCLLKSPQTCVKSHSIKLNHI